MTAKKTESWRKALPKRITELQRMVEKELRKNWDRATDLLPPALRKAIKQMTANVERMQHDLQKRGDKLVANARKRAERLGTDVRKRFEEVVTPLTNRFDVASRDEVDRLRKRLHDLERKIEAAGHHSAHAA